MMNILQLLLILAVISHSALALELGDPAPKISPDKWIAGEECDPSSPDGKTIYLVEVWGASCAPCLKSTPILNDLQKRYARQGLKIISFTTDDEESIRDILASHPLEYSSFLDKDGATNELYMVADGRDSIPQAFLFDKSGVLVWLGNPLDNLEDKIKRVISGELNAVTAAEIRAATAMLKKAQADGDVDALFSSLAKLEALEPDNAEHYENHYTLLCLVGEKEDLEDLRKSWYNGCRNNPQALMVLASTAMEKGFPDSRNPAFALAVAKRAWELTGPSDIDSGLTLAESYRAVGRFDLALEILSKIKLQADNQEKDMVEAFADYYRKLQDAGNNPDVAPIP